MYCTTEYLNYQGLELAKGILKFKKSELVHLTDKEAINYLKIFGANSYGNKLNKKSFNDRISWVDSNLENIINFENGILLNKAENKILFVSFCLNLRNTLKQLKIMIYILKRICLFNLMLVVMVFNI